MLRLVIGMCWPLLSNTSAVPAFILCFQDQVQSHPATQNLNIEPYFQLPHHNLPPFAMVWTVLNAPQRTRVLGADSSHLV